MKAVFQHTFGFELAERFADGRGTNVELLGALILHRAVARFVLGKYDGFAKKLDYTVFIGFECRFFHFPLSA
jgi:hypothetical protein